MSTELTVLPKELNDVVISSGLDKANTHAASFAPFMIKCNELSNKINGLHEDNPVDVKIAREVRLALVKNRTASEKVKDQSKATLLAESNLIQSLFNVIKSKSQLLEADFEKIEKAAEIKEAARKTALKEDRTIKLSEFNIDITAYNLAEMSDDTFNDLLTSQQLLKQEREAAAAKAEAERLERERKEAEERERIRQENERLRKEAEEKEKQLAAERAAAEAEADRIAKENAAKLAEIERQNKIAREKAEAEQRKKDEETARILREQKAAADKLAAELQDKLNKEAEEAKAKRVAENLAKIAAEKAAKAPVKEKLTIWVNGFTIPEPPDAAGKEIYEKFVAFKQWAAKQIEAI